MIQAPQTGYIPAYQPMPTVIPQQGANNNVTYAQTPGYFYNYPSTSAYAQPMTKSQYNGVNIEIVNPQGQGLTPFGPQQQNVSQYVPAQYIPYNAAPMPQAPVYQPNFPASQAIAYPPVQPMPQAIDPQAAAAQVPAAPVVPAPQIPSAAAPVVDTPVVTVDPSMTPEAFAGKLKTDDLDSQKAAIEEVATLVKNNKEVGKNLLDTQVYDALVEIINKDTSGLEGPTQEVKDLRSKNKDELTPEEKVKAETPSPFEKAEINKQYAIYTIGYLNELLNNELVAQNQKPVDIEALPCINTIVEAIKANPNPVIRKSGISTLSHIARPEYKDTFKTIFELAQADENTEVKEAATSALSLINQ